MRGYSRLLLLFGIILPVLLACDKIESEVVPDEDVITYGYAKGTYGIRRVVDSLELQLEEPYQLGEQIPNPYSLRHIQEVCDTLCDRKHIPREVLPPNTLYVRFLPQDTTEYQLLISQGYDLFDFPLDCEIGEGDYYHDSSIPEGQMTWHYASIPLPATLPAVTYEVLDTCYVPPYDNQPQVSSISPRNSVIDSPSFNMELESLAYERAGLSYMQPFLPHPGEIINSFSSRPSGYVKVRINGDYFPVKRVKVSAWSFVKVASTYTDENGYYHFSTSFCINPRYTVQYENYRGFKVYRTLIEVDPIHKWTKHHSKNGYNFSFTSGKMWRGAVVNNCVYDYYKLCELDGRQAPPSNLHITARENGDCPGYTPMLHQMGRASVASFSDRDLLTFLGEQITANVINLIHDWLPDIVVKENTYGEMAACIFHELSHASHYSRVGRAFWGPLVNHYILNGRQESYGDGLSNGSTGQDYCELCEAWGYANERLYLKHFSGITNPAKGNSEWFYPAIDALYQLMDSGILNEKEVLLGLTSAHSINGLYSALISMYPNKSLAITDCFAGAGALTYQTCWRIINRTGGVLDLTLRKNGQYRNHIGDTLLFASHPYQSDNFYISNWNHPYERFYPDTTYLVVNGNMVFQQLNRVTVKPLNRPFFNALEWRDTLVHRDEGNKTIKEYQFVLNHTDY